MQFVAQTRVHQFHNNVQAVTLPIQLMVLWYTVTTLLLFNDVTFQIARSSRPISFTCNDTLSDLNDFTYKHRIRGQQQPKRLSIGVGTIVLVRTVHTSPYELWEPIRETNSNLSIGTGYEKTWRRRDKAQVESQSAESHKSW